MEGVPVGGLCPGLECHFTIADSNAVFAGWTDNSRWSGWLNVEVMPGTRDAIVEEVVAIARRYTDYDLSPEEIDMCATTGW